MDIGEQRNPLRGRDDEPATFAALHQFQNVRHVADHADGGRVLDRIHFLSIDVRKSDEVPFGLDGDGHNSR
jgi:hypothetical protein